jgi:transposase
VGLPTERMVAHVLVAKYADHCPLYRQTQILARKDIVIDRADAGLLGRLWRSRAEKAVASHARRAARFSQALR